MPYLRTADGSRRTRLSRSQRTPGEAELSSSESGPDRREHTEEEILALMADGDLRPLGLMRNASNGTFLCEHSSGALVVYKPRAGEAPLWDFPDGTLCLREVAAYAVSSATGWDFVPPTIMRDGPMGEGSVQLFIEADPGQHYLTLAAGHEEIFRRVAAFDVVINNADRKSGHCLLERFGERIWVVDHGVSFHPSPKLRTVIWDYEGEPLPPDVIEGLLRIETAIRRSPGLSERLEQLLAPEEIEAFLSRAQALVESGRFPSPGSDRPFPWPPI